MKNPELNIKHFREKAGLTQNELSRRLNMSQSFISALERGVKSPTVRVLYKIAAELKICPRMLLRCKMKYKIKKLKVVYIREVEHDSSNL